MAAGMGSFIGGALGDLYFRHNYDLWRESISWGVVCAIVWIMAHVIRLENMIKKCQR